MSKFSMCRILKDSSGVKLSGVTKTASFNSEAFSLGSTSFWGVYVDIGAVTGTMAVKVQTSFDGGSTWLDFYPQAENSETQATLANITATIETGKMWPTWFYPESAEGSEDSIVIRCRLVFTLTSTPSFAITKIYLVGRGFD